MKNKSIQIFLVCVVVCFLFFNIRLQLIHQQNRNQLRRVNHKIEQLENIELKFILFKETTSLRYKYEQYNIGDTYIYLGSDNNTFTSFRSIADQPKLVIGLNQNMCRPCIEGVFAAIKEIFPDFEKNSNIICIADINSSL